MSVAEATKQELSKEEGESNKNEKRGLGLRNIDVNVDKEEKG